MDRRDFIKLGCAACGITAAAAFIASCSTSSNSSAAQGPSANFTLDLSNSANAALNTVGGSVVSNGVIVACTGTNAFTALAVSCTHEGCSVGYSSNGKNFVCPCHSGTFDLNGKVTGGPPPSPLKKYAVTQSGNILTIKG